VIAVNLGDGPAQGRVALARDLPGTSDTVTFDDLIDGQQYLRPRAALESDGLFVRLEQGRAHLFAVRDP
jgi:hypothetical protein